MRENLQPGYQLDRYELLCPIAQGGMAEVFVGRLCGKYGFEKLVAIKTILPQFAGDRMFQTMFLDEARIASGIQHENVAQILDLGEWDDILYMVMEWVDGDSLARLFREVTNRTPGAKMPAGIVQRILADTCAGLHAAHTLRDNTGSALTIVHRDVSPQNVLISTAGVAKLIDFGVAKARDRLGGETNYGMLKGKLRYMAPEQVGLNQIDARADVWAIGAMLYHLTAGHPAYEGPNELASLKLLTAGMPPPPLPAGTSAPIVDIIERTLQHDPEKRFASAVELREALEHAMTRANLHTTTRDVAAFMAHTLGGQADRRRRDIDAAIRGIAEGGGAAELDDPSSLPTLHKPMQSAPPPRQRGRSGARTAGGLDGLGLREGQLAVPSGSPRAAAVEELSASCLLDFDEGSASKSAPRVLSPASGEGAAPAPHAAFETHAATPVSLASPLGGESDPLFARDNRAARAPEMPITLPAPPPESEGAGTDEGGAAERKESSFEPVALAATDSVPSPEARLESEGAEAAAAARRTSRPFGFVIAGATALALLAAYAAGGPRGQAVVEQRVDEEPAHSPAAQHASGLATAPLLPATSTAASASAPAAAPSASTRASASASASASTGADVDVSMRDHMHMDMHTHGAAPPNGPRVGAPPPPRLPKPGEDDPGF